MPQQPSLRGKKLIDFPKLLLEIDATHHQLTDVVHLAAGRHEKLHWRCRVGADHRWEASIANRTRGRGCPFCAGQRTDPKRSLAALYPELAAQIDREKHPDLDAFALAPGADRKLWWLCSSGHSWEARIANRVSLGRGCPTCRGGAAAPGHNLADLYPEIAAEFAEDLNGLPASAVSPKSGKSYEWRCARSGHVFPAVVANRTGRGDDCSVCTGRLVIPETSLGYLYPTIAAELDKELNPGVDPMRLSPGCNTRMTWRCAADPTHVWPTSVTKRVHAGRGCPFCAGQRATPTHNLAVLFPDVAQELDLGAEGAIPADQITPYAQRKVVWRCRFDPTHRWPALVSNRTGQLRSGCPHCDALSRTSALEIRIAYLLAEVVTVAEGERWVALPDGRAEVDIILPELKVIVEYDGARWHTNPERDYAKSARLRDGGWDVIRVRQAPLETRDGDVTAPKNPTPHRVAEAVLRELNRRYGCIPETLTGAQRRHALEVAEQKITTLREMQRRKRLPSSASVSRSARLTS